MRAQGAALALPLPPELLVRARDAALVLAQRLEPPPEPERLQAVAREAAEAVAAGLEADRAAALTASL